MLVDRNLRHHILSLFDRLTRVGGLHPPVDPHDTWHFVVPVFDVGAKEIENPTYSGQEAVLYVIFDVDAQVP